jgi:hypothetical protein
MGLLVFWLIFLIAGILIGAQKGQLVSGIVWPFLFGPLGVIIVLCLPNKVAEAKEEARNLQVQRQLFMQQQQLEELRRLNNPVPEKQQPARLRIAQNGQDMGEMSIGMVLTMLKSKQLTGEDLYFDSETNEWLPLEGL